MIKIKTKALYGGMMEATHLFAWANFGFRRNGRPNDEDYGPCPCGNRATIPVAIPVSWVEGEEAETITALLEKNEFPFAQGYDYRRVFGPVRQGDYLLGFSACPACCQRAQEMGIAEEGTLRPAGSRNPGKIKNMRRVKNDLG